MARWHATAPWPGASDHYAHFVADLLAKRYDYWALGHIHYRQFLEQPILYAGNTQGRSIKEGEGPTW